METKETQLKEKRNSQATENHSHQETWPLAAGGLVLWGRAIAAQREDLSSDLNNPFKSSVWPFTGVCL